MVVASLRWLYHRLTAYDQAVFFDKQGYMLPSYVLGCLNVRSPWRQAAIMITFWPTFDHLILTAILVNCTLMVLSPYPGYEHLEADSDVYFVALFAAEMVVKVRAHVTQPK